MTMPAPLDQTPEERALAQRLARVGPHGEPSPQIDARVLAAARAALDAPEVPTHRSRRWPVALGLAASLVLAVGVAWRLRPLPPGSAADLAKPSHTTIQSGPARAAAEPATAAPAAQTAPAEAADASIAVESPPPPEAAPRRAAKNVAAPPPALDEQVDADVPAPVSSDVAAAAVAPESPPKADAAQSTAGAATSANETDELDRAARSQAQPQAADEPLDAMPPATADAPGVRDAWLSRIRALIDSGDVAGGRRSLHTFVERYPDYPLPEDLRALQQ